MNPAPPRLQAALLSGLFIGVLSALPFLKLCCCLWVISGGVLAVYLMQQNHPYAITTADGALIGLMAGVMGGVLATLISIPIDLIMAPFNRRLMEWFVANPDVPPEMRQLIENASLGGITAFAVVLNLFFRVIVDGLFAMLGGLLGVALFKKRELPPPGTVEVLPPV